MMPLPIEALTGAAFAAFGEVIEPEAATRVYPINEATALRYHALARVDCAAEQGRPVISWVRAQARVLPFEVRVLERHPLGSQAFVPLSAAAYLVVVAATPAAVPRVFLAERGQGVNFHRGTWHHPLLALEKNCDFLVVDREGPGDNCEEVALARTFRIEHWSS